MARAGHARHIRTVHTRVSLGARVHVSVRATVCVLSLRPDCTHRLHWDRRSIGRSVARPIDRFLSRRCMRRRAEPTTSASPSRMPRPPRQVRPEAASRSRCSCSIDVRACAAVCVRACARARFVCVWTCVRACVRACVHTSACFCPSVSNSLAPAPLALSLHTFSARHRTRTTANRASRWFAFPVDAIRSVLSPRGRGVCLLARLFVLRVCLFSDPAACCGVCVRGDRATACRCAAVGRYGGLDRAARRLSYVRQGTQRCCAHCRPPVAAVEC